MTPAAGDELGPYAVRPVELEDMRALAQILADPNPVHVDAAAARAAGLGERPINPGPANFGYVLEMLRASFPDGLVTSLEVRLLANVAAGDRLVAGGRVQSVGEAGAQCFVWLDVVDGGRALEGTATVSAS